MLLKISEYPTGFPKKTKREQPIKQFDTSCTTEIYTIVDHCRTSDLSRKQFSEILLFFKCLIHHSARVVLTKCPTQFGWVECSQEPKRCTISRCIALCFPEDNEQTFLSYLRFTSSRTSFYSTATPKFNRSYIMGNISEQRSGNNIASFFLKISRDLSSCAILSIQKNY